MARDCATRAAKVKTQTSNSSSNAVASAGKGAAKVFARVADAIIKTGSALSMLSSAFYARLRDARVIQPFTRAAPDVVGVKSASAEIRGDVDAPVEVAGVTVHHPLLVVEGLAFSLLIVTDILRANSVVLTLDEASPVRLRNRECFICREHRTESPTAPPLASRTACAACSVAIEPCTAGFIRVRVSTALCKLSNVAVEPLASLLDKHGCAALPSVYGPFSSEFFLPIANPSNSRGEIPTYTFVTEIAPIAHAANSTSTAASNPRLSRNEKLRKVLRELQVAALHDSSPHKRSLGWLVSKNLDIFAESDADVGTTSLAFHEIDTPDTRPFRQPVRRLPYGEVRKAVANEIVKLTIAGIARPSTSFWASPVVMVRKKDGGLRMCVENRRLNYVTKSDCFPLPLLDEALDAFAGATVFSSLDLAITYHQVPVKHAHVEKTALITHVGLYEMMKMPFSICNAPSTYQRLMMSVIQGLIGRICLAYLDDVIVFSKRRDEHVNDLRAVLDRIRDAGLKLKPAKCKLFCKQVLYLGHVISPGGVSPDPSKLRVLPDWPLPTTVRELQSFLGFVNFYSDFIAEPTAMTSLL